ncbi:MAG: uracil-DNA glycosylase [Spirochaetaceae bacterium]|nr:uracil-DNA glycosylase [Spirochaetaceae bacterium]
MTAEEKQRAARFLDTVSDYTQTGYALPKPTYHFTTDTLPPAAVARPAEAVPAQADDAWMPEWHLPEWEVEKGLRALAEEISVCRKCPLAAGRKNTVPGEGSTRPAAMVIGEGPGAGEDESGRPFVGPAGQLLDKMLALVGLERRKNCFIANVVKCRPPGNRNPEPLEINTCMPFLRRQIELLRPHAILAAGNVPAGALLGTTEGITRLHGRWNEWQCASGKKIPVLPTFHPSYLLRNDSQKPDAFEDFIKLSRRLQTLDAAYDRSTIELRKNYDKHLSVLRKTYQK